MPQVLGTDPGEGISGFGTTLEGASTGPLGMITRMQLGGLDVTTDIDITTMNTPARWMLFIAGLKDAKDVSMDLLYEKTNMATILAALGGTNEAWTITFPDGSTLVCDGYIKHLGSQIPVNDKIAQTATLKLSGPPTFTPGS